MRSLILITSQKNPEIQYQAPESQKGQKAKDGNKEYKPSMHYQRSAKSNQYETHTFKSSSRNSDRVRSTINNMNIELSGSEYDDLVLDLIDDYLEEESWSKEKKKPS
ncbi:hypothetical protein F8M41_023440 [Gigaspora margarita]|uniref:Uncharacterized protein n=1 Tax=Gigaspora margarita TaxID=4874 RepID=A0A8H4ADE6_GIGMA|nr:hypothetical protein F8M41_023440 [Gigaspora margarita]